MPPAPPQLAPKPHKPYFYYGHRKPTQNRPTVRGGLFTNRRTLKPPTTARPEFSQPFELQKWDPDGYGPNPPPPTRKDPSEDFFTLAKRLSPIARYIVDAFRKHKQWSPELIAELNRLRRVTPSIVTEVLKFPHVDPRMSTKLFSWAGKQKGYRHDFACYNAYSYFLNRVNQFRAADQVPELMNMQGKPPGEKQFEILIRMHADANRGLRVHYVYEKMKKFGVKPRVFLYNRIMDALVKTDHLDLALSVYGDFKGDGLVEENVTYMILIKGFCKANRIEEALSLVDEMRKKLCKPDVFAYTAMVKTLISKGNLDGCLRVWKEMEEDNIEPDVMAYWTLLTALCKEKRVDEGYELFKEMKERNYLIDRGIYGSLIEAFVDQGRVGKSCELLKDLIDCGYRADLPIFNSLIRGFCKEGLVDKACKLFQETVREELSPDFHTVNPILISYAGSKRMDEFSKMLERIQRVGISVPEILLEFFRCMLEKKKEDGLSTALKVFEFLKTKGHTNVPMYNMIMEALLSNGEEKKAIKLFDELNSSSSSALAPDSSSYSHAITCHVRLGDADEACKLYNKVVETSSVPTIEAYSSLAKALCKKGEIDAAMMLIRDCLANVAGGPAEFKYALTVIDSCKSNDARKAVEVVDELVEEGWGPGEAVVICCAAIYGMCKHGSIEEARRFFEAMKEKGYVREADVIAYDEMLVEHMKKTTADLVVSGIRFFGLQRRLKAKGFSLLGE